MKLFMVFQDFLSFWWKIIDMINTIPSINPNLNIIPPPHPIFFIHKNTSPSRSYPFFYEEIFVILSIVFLIS